MRGVRKFLLVLAAVAAIVVGLAACGGGETSDSTATSSTATAPQGTPKRDSESAPKGDRAEGGSQAKGSGSFVVPHGDNSIQTYGAEASAGERRAAETAAATFLEARAEGNWAKACTVVAAITLKQVEIAAAKTEVDTGDCARLLKLLLGPVPALARADTMTDGLGSFRVDGGRGFALYHGPRGVDYVITMIKEGGDWKLVALAPNELS
jgi:hypothetical protein